MADSRPVSLLAETALAPVGGGPADPDADLHSMADTIKAIGNEAFKVRSRALACCLPST